MHEIELVSVDALKPNPRNARTHSKKQIRHIANNIDVYGFTVPVLIDENWMLLAGHGRLEAAKLLGLKRIPAIRLHGLSEAKKRALLLADNKIAENAGWDRERLAIELPELTELLIEEPALPPRASSRSTLGSLIQGPAGEATVVIQGRQFRR